MFFPDKPRAYAEARRVLRPGGLFAFCQGTPLRGEIEARGAGIRARVVAVTA